MLNSVRALLAAAGLVPEGVVAWAERVPAGRPGVYLVALTDDADAVLTPRDVPLDDQALDTLITLPTLRVDGRVPTRAELAARLAACWLPDEAVVYIGCSKRPLVKRVGEYYRTPLGARAPHAGGWPVKTLACPLFIHYAETPDFVRAERAMLDAFAAGTIPATRARLHDATRPIPFANLSWPGHGHKLHGIDGARG